LGFNNEFAQTYVSILHKGSVLGMLEEIMRRDSVKTDTGSFGASLNCLHRRDAIIERKEEQAREMNNERS
jgi:hypothetical protein